MGDDKDLYVVRLVDRGMVLAGRLALYLLIGYCVYEGGSILAQIMSSLAGEETNAHITFEFYLFQKQDGSFSVALALALVLALLLGIYGIIQGLIRRRTVERLHPHTKSLEQILDRKRSSSQLLSDGRTNPNDE